jgi:hypothetical protein
MRKYCTVKGKYKFIALSKVGGGEIAFRAFVRSFVRPSWLTLIMLDIQTTTNHRVMTSELSCTSLPFLCWFFFVVVLAILVRLA